MYTVVFTKFFIFLGYKFIISKPIKKTALFCKNLNYFLKPLILKALKIDFFARV